MKPWGTRYFWAYFLGLTIGAPTTILGSPVVSNVHLIRLKSMNLQELRTALSGLKEPLNLQKTATALYQFQAVQEFVPEHMKDLIHKPREYLEHLGVVMPERGLLGGTYRGERVQAWMSGYTGWAQFDFDNTRPLGENHGRVYINIPLERMQNEFDGIFQSAKASGASALKFSLGNERYLTRPDRMIVGFDGVRQAARYAAERTRHFEAAGISGARVPFTLRVGNPDVSPVSMARDINPPFTFKSWRETVAESIAWILLSYEGNDPTEYVRRKLKLQGIDPDYWLPTNSTQMIISELSR